MATKQGITSQTIISNIPNIIGVIVILIMFIDYFIKGGLALGVPGGFSANVRNWLSIPVVTWAVIVSTIRACILYADKIVKRVENWWGYIIFFVSFFGMMIVNVAFAGGPCAAITSAALLIFAALCCAWSTASCSEPDAVCR